MPEPVISPAQRRFIEACRRAVLVTVAPDGRPRPIPICVALVPDQPRGATLLYSPIDEKPKRTADPLALARVRDIALRPSVSLLFDRWDEDWTRLAWLRLEAAATILGVADSTEPGPPVVAERTLAIGLLRRRYPQYEAQSLEARPLLRFDVTRVVAWGAIEDSS